MPGTFDKKKIAAVLFAAAVIILIANIIADKPGEYVQNPIGKRLSGSEIDSQFIAALKNLGYENSWIKKEKPGKKAPGSLYSYYEVKVPQDLPIAVILSEIQNSFAPDNVKLHSVEEKINGPTRLDIYNAGSAKLRAVFSYDNKIERVAGDIGLLITGIENLNNEEDSIILNSANTFAAVVVPSKKSFEFVMRLRDYRKEYVVILNDDIPDLKYKLRASYTKDMLKKSIRTIIGNYSRAVFFIIDNKSDLYNSSVYSFIKNEFDRRKIKLLNFNNIKIINENGSVPAVFNSLVLEAKGGKELIYLSAEDYLAAHNKIVSLRKIGFKFINPSIVVNE